MKIGGLCVIRRLKIEEKLRRIERWKIMKRIEWLKEKIKEVDGLKKKDWVERRKERGEFIRIIKEREEGGDRIMRNVLKKVDKREEEEIGKGDCWKRSFILVKSGKERKNGKKGVESRKGSKD